MSAILQKLYPGVDPAEFDPVKGRGVLAGDENGLRVMRWEIPGVPAPSREELARAVAEVEAENAEKKAFDAERDALAARFRALPPRLRASSRHLFRAVIEALDEGEIAEGIEILRLAEPPSGLRREEKVAFEAARSKFEDDLAFLAGQL